MTTPPSPALALQIEHLAAEASLRDPAWRACVSALPPAARAALLQRADRLDAEGPRGRDRASACYVALAGDLDPARAADLPRLRAIVLDLQGARAELAPLWRAVRRQGPPDLAAHAAGLLGSIALQAGDREGAERAYRDGFSLALPLGGLPALDLCTAYVPFALQTGRELEAGVWLRRARALLGPSTSPWRRACLAVLEGALAARLVDRARLAAAEARLLAELPGCRPPHRRRAAPEVAMFRLERALLAGEGAAALEALDEHALAWEQLGGLRGAALGRCAAQGVRARALAGRREDALAFGLAALEGFPAGHAHALPLEVELHALRQADPAGDRGRRAAARLGPLEALRTRLAEGASGGPWTGERLQQALQLADRLVELTGEAPHEVYELLARLGLERLSELRTAAQADPGLAEVLPADVEAHEPQRQRLLRRHWPLSAAVARRLLDPDAPRAAPAPLDLSSGHVSVCAWCRRVLLADGLWLPVSTFLSLAPAPGLRLTHCVCGGCAPGVSAGLGGPPAGG